MGILRTSWQTTPHVLADIPSGPSRQTLTPWLTTPPVLAENPSRLGRQPLLSWQTTPHVLADKPSGLGRQPLMTWQTSCHVSTEKSPCFNGCSRYCQVQHASPSESTVGWSTFYFSNY